MNNELNRKPVCTHRKGKMIDFNEETFVGTWKCKLCGESFSRKAVIVCTTEVEELADHVRRNNIKGHSINVDGYCNMGCC